MIFLLWTILMKLMSYNQEVENRPKENPVDVAFRLALTSPLIADKI